ncbi:MAG: hypothetical protein HYY38_05645, partial [Rhodospirillales bacterium]|nr:hypothetical protein [Rhodospirillales bacterium]
QTEDLGRTLQELRRETEIVDYDKNGGLFVTWSMIKPEFQPGVLRYLQQVLRPVVVNPDLPGEEEESIPVLLPGAPAQGAS